MDSFDDQFLAEESPESIGFSLDEEPAFFPLEEAAEEGEEGDGQPQQEESIYTDDPVRVYLREMGAVPLLTREGEVSLARKMERGKVRAQKALSRSPLVHTIILDLIEQAKRNQVEIDEIVDLGVDVEEGSAAIDKKVKQVLEQLNTITLQQKKLNPLLEKAEAVPAANKKLRKKAFGKYNRSRIELSLAIRAVPWTLARWKQFTKELERAVERMEMIDQELQKLENGRTSQAAQTRIREAKKELRAMEKMAGATLVDLRVSLQKDRKSVV